MVELYNTSFLKQDTISVISYTSHIQTMTTEADLFVSGVWITVINELKIW